MDTPQEPTLHLDDARRDPRWVDVRTALVRFGDAEHPAVTGDLSLGGLKVAVVGGHPRAEQRISVAVAFEETLLELEGRVAYVLRHPWGSTVGVQCPETPQGYLARRYRQPGPHPGARPRPPA